MYSCNYMPIVKMKRFVFYFWIHLYVHIHERCTYESFEIYFFLKSALPVSFANTSLGSPVVVRRLVETSRPKFAYPASPQDWCSSGAPILKLVLPGKGHFV